MFASGSSVKAEAMDMQIHNDRISTANTKRTFTAEPSDLPDGVMIVLVEERDVPRLLCKGQLHRWSFDGYSDPVNVIEGATQVLTPMAICSVLIAGYPVEVHPSALRPL